MKQITILLSIILTFFACSGSSVKVIEGYQLVTVPELYQIQIPEQLAEVKGKLAENASLEYWDAENDGMITIIQEEKSMFVEYLEKNNLMTDGEPLLLAFRDWRMEYFTGSGATQINHASDSRNEQINGLNAEVMEVETYNAETREEVMYMFAFIESNDKLYTINANFEISHITELKPKFEKAFSTFQEL